MSTGEGNELFLCLLALKIILKSKQYILEWHILSFILNITYFIKKKPHRQQVYLEKYLEC